MMLGLSRFSTRCSTPKMFRSARTGRPCRSFCDSAKAQEPFWRVSDKLNVYRVMMRSAKTYPAPYNNTLMDRVRSTWKQKQVSDTDEQDLSNAFRCLKLMTTNEPFVQDFLTYGANGCHDPVSLMTTTFSYENGAVVITDRFHPEQKVSPKVPDFVMLYSPESE